MISEKPQSEKDVRIAFVKANLKHVKLVFTESSKSDLEASHADEKIKGVPNHHSKDDFEEEKYCVNDKKDA